MTEVQPVLDGFTGGVHGVERPVGHGGGHSVFDDAHRAFGGKVVQGFVVGHHSPALDFVEKLHQRGFVFCGVEAMMGLPLLVEGLFQTDFGGVGRLHIILEDGFHRLQGFLVLHAQHLIVLVNGEVERRIERLVLPRFEKLVFVTERSLLGHLPIYQQYGQNEHEYLGKLIITMSEKIKKIG